MISNPSVRSFIYDVTPPIMLKAWRTGKRQALDQLARKRFADRAEALTGVRKIIYATTPPVDLPNVGDHAQTLATYKWLKTHYPNTPILELDKHDAICCLDILRSVVTDSDIVFLQSGGNLGDRGVLSEISRRKVIEEFHDLPIIILPQTIYFSATSVGRREKEITRRLYGRHPNLTIVGRDLESKEAAEKLFPNAQVLCAPDIVLVLSPEDFQLAKKQSDDSKHSPASTLLCMRSDDERYLTDEELSTLKNSVPGHTTVANPTILDRIPLARRNEVVKNTLAFFLRHDAVVTDRFHGLIFSAICRLPVVALRSVDHKLVAGMEWFKEDPLVSLVTSVDEVAGALDDVFRSEPRLPVTDPVEHFDRLAEALSLDLT